MAGTRACLCLGEGKRGLRLDVMGPSLLPRCLVAPSPHPGPPRFLGPGSECRLFQLARSPTCVQPGGTGGPACGARVPKQLQGAHPAGRQPLSPTRGVCVRGQLVAPAALGATAPPWSACVVRRTPKWTRPLSLPGSPAIGVHATAPCGLHSHPAPAALGDAPGQPRAHPRRAGSAVGVRAWAPVWAPGGLSPASQRSIDGASGKVFALLWRLRDGLQIELFLSTWK